MYALNILSSLNRSFSAKARTVFLSLRKPQRSFKFKYTTFNQKLPQNEVVLYKYENPRFFIMLNLGSGVQCAFWTYLGVFLYESIKASHIETKGKEFWNNVSERERKYSDVLSGIALFFGWSMFIATIFYSLRSVRKIILHQNGRTLTIITYNFPGRNIINVPLSSVSAAQQRAKAKKFIPMKVKSKWFYYLIDVEGEFHPNLFDCTAGVQRNF